MSIIQRLRIYVRRALVAAILVVFTLAGAWLIEQTHQFLQTNDVGYRLILASEGDNAVGVRQLLAGGADLNYRFNGATALDIARKHHNSEIEALIVKAGARD